jgi:hypothetical protein
MARRIRALVGVVVTAVFVVAVGSAWAGDDLKVRIKGTAQDGATLTAHADVPASATILAWQWLRCQPAKRGTCNMIDGATSDSYLVVASDVGFRLRVRIEVVDADDGDVQHARSNPTAIVIAAPIETPTPAPSPVPPEPSPPPPAPSPTTQPVLHLQPPPYLPQPRHERRRAKPRLLHPFPVIRIRGRLTTTGARVTLLTVRGPRGVRIAARCRGRGCPRRPLAVAAAVTRLERFERRLRAGTRLEIKVTKPGYIGKWSIITVRRGRPPARLDRCVYPGGRRPVRCPRR